jgi:hypothetical protein
MLPSITGPGSTIGFSGTKEPRGTSLTKGSLPFQRKTPQRRKLCRPTGLGRTRALPAALPCFRDISSRELQLEPFQRKERMFCSTIGDRRQTMPPRCIFGTYLDATLLIRPIVDMSRPIRNVLVVGINFRQNAERCSCFHSIRPFTLQFCPS